MTLSVPFGQLEALRNVNHERYCHQPTRQFETEKRDAPEEPDEAAQDNPKKGDDDDPYEFKLGDPEEL